RGLGQRLALDQPVESGFIDDLGAGLLRRGELRGPDLFTRDEEAGAGLDLVVHFAARGANGGVHVLALPREHARDTEAHPRERTRSRHRVPRLWPRDAELREP